MSGRVAPSIVKEGLVLYLDAANPRSYVSGSTTWRDLTANNSSGSLVNGPIFNANNGGSLLFDGSDDYLSMASNFPLNNEITIIIWINTSNTESQLINYPISLGNFGIGSYGIWVGGIFSSANVAAKSIGFVSGSTVSSAIANSFTTIDYSKWNQICLSYNSSVGSKLYKNTVLLSMYSNEVNGSINFNTINIGRRMDNVWYFNGNIANTQIYNRALSSQEILQNYNATKGRFNIT